MNALMTGAIYGFVRAPLAGFTTPLVQKFLPSQFSQYAPQVGNALASFAAAKYGSGMVRDTGLTGLRVEAANTTGAMGTTSSNASGMTFY